MFGAVMRYIAIYYVARNRDTIRLLAGCVLVRSINPRIVGTILASNNPGSARSSGTEACLIRTARTEKKLILRQI